jgi:hypothetical protein
LAELALTAGLREAGTGDRLAPARISALLALAIPEARSTPDPGRAHRVAYILVIMELNSRRIVLVNATSSPGLETDVNSTSASRR